MRDEVIGPVYEAVMTKRKPSTRKHLHPKTQILFHQYNKLTISDNILIRRTKNKNQIILPSQFHQLVYTELHDKMAHLGSEKVIDLAQQRFYWPKMTKDIEHYVQRKCRCIKDKKPNHQVRAPLVNIKSSTPFQMISIDYLKLDKCKGGFQYVLMVCDHFTRFTQAYPTKNKSGRAAADKFF